MAIRGPFGAEKPITSKNVGTVASGSSVVEYGDGIHHQSVITVDTTLGAIAGGAALGLGKLVYTLPDGALDIKASYISMALTASEANIPSDTPEVGLGTVVASAAVSVLNGTTEFDEIMVEQTATDCNGTATVAHVATSLVVATGDVHAIFFNVAATWTASGDAACAIAGTIILEWVFIT